MVLLRLAPRHCWLVVALSQNECCHGRSDAQQFSFCFSTRDAQARKRFLIDLRARYFSKKGFQRWILRNIACTFFFMNIDKTRPLD
jgi:hypothetical protein